jgi:hypothetical protein
MLGSLGVGIAWHGTRGAAVETVEDGPTLFLAFTPISWQGAHTLNKVRPAVRSAAPAIPLAVSKATTIIVGRFSMAGSSNNVGLTQGL